MEINKEFGISFESMEAKYEEFLDRLDFNMRSILAHDLMYDGPVTEAAFTGAPGADTTTVTRETVPKKEGSKALPSSSPYPAPTGTFKDKEAKQ